jgi:hypothetical protein
MNPKAVGHEDKHGNELSNSTNGREFLYQQSDLLFLKKDFAQ